MAKGRLSYRKGPAVSSHCTYAIKKQSSEQQPLGLHRYVLRPVLSTLWRGPSADYSKGSAFNRAMTSCMSSCRVAVPSQGCLGLSVGFLQKQQPERTTVMRKCEHIQARIFLWV